MTLRRDRVTALGLLALIYAGLGLLTYLLGLSVHRYFAAASVALSWMW